MPPTLFDELLVVGQLKPRAQGSEIVQIMEHFSAFSGRRGVWTPQHTSWKLVYGVQ